MADAKTKTKKTALLPRIRVTRAGHVILGPGKVQLLESIARGKSLREAASDMGMSYMKAWLMAGLMNRSFQNPLLTMERGGAGGGGTKLTRTGERVLALYQEMQAASLEAMKVPWKEMQRLMKTSR